ncbi:hypothetical protein [Virgibacillus halodenitrificans]|uniref:hypothetical protein n=1 Tax=Virgibacillus halodenitrificans TaxID=1482 RepID=UPI000EF5266E|nr:hypothetical protein [Virgibacillus halodenitrificans]
MKKIDFQKLEKNLEKYQKEEEYNQRGLANVIRFVWNHYPTQHVDFDSFSYDDIMEAMDALSAIPVDDYMDEIDEMEKENVRNNPWFHNMIVENTVANLFHTKNKFYENDDDFI